MTALIHTTRCLGFCCGNGLPIVVVRCCWLHYGFEYNAFGYDSETEVEMVK